MTTANNLNKLYNLLKPEERFRLILAASGRGDFAETERLAAASKSLELKVQDYAPWARAFTELAMIMFMEFVEIAARYQEATYHWSGVFMNREHARVEEEADDAPDSAGAESSVEFEPSEDEKLDMKAFGTMLSVGFILKTKTAGWKLFCEQMNVPPLTMWELFPGYDRLAAALKQTEGTKEWLAMSFQPEGMLQFLTLHRPEGLSEPKMAGLMTAEAVAKELDEMFRDMVKQCGG
jgi:hypothetical protein